MIDPNATRTVKGNVWETVNQPANYWLENKDLYPKYENSNGAGDITAELVEIKNGVEYVRAKTKTNSDGYYNFTEYIPGQYVVRFIYAITCVVCIPILIIIFMIIIVYVCVWICFTWLIELSIVCTFILIII